MWDIDRLGFGRPHTGTALFLLIMLGTPPARGQSKSDSAAAQGLFDEGKALMAAGKTAEACPKFEESQRLDPGSGTLVNLAKCYERTGRIASAWSKYIEAAIAAKAAANPERESVARELAAALAPRISKFRVSVPPEAQVPGLELARDGAIVGQPQWGSAIPADEGKHTILARAPGYKEWSAEVLVKGEGTVSEVSVPRLERAPTSTPLGSGSSHPAEMDETASGLGAQRAVAITAFGVGAAGLAVGTIFGLKAMSQQNEAETYCDGTACRDPRGVSAGNDAHAAGNVATVGMIVGAAGAVAGLALWFTAPHESGSKPSTEVGIGAGTVHFRGAF